jgi:hypothetical protein
MSDLDDIKEWIEEEYNQFISVYDYDDSLRMTDGSAGHYLDITIEGDTVHFEGVKGDVNEVEEECDLDRESVLNTLAKAF